MGQRKLLGESRVRRFMELAGNSKHASRFINENLNTDLTEEELEEEINELEMEEEYVEEGGMGRIPGMGEDAMAELDMMDEYAMDEEGLELQEEEEEEDAEDPEVDDAPEMDAAQDEDVDVTIDEEQVASLRTAVEVLNSIIEASEGGDEAEPEPGAEGGEEDPMAGMDDMAAAEPEAPEGGEEDPEMTAESIERITKRVLDRVTKRLVQEAIKR